MEIPLKKAWFNIILHTILPAAVTLILFALTIFFFTVPEYKRAIYKERRQLIKDMTDMGYSLLLHYYQRTLQGELTTEESQRRVIERIRSIRYGPEQKDYFWINDFEPKMVMHPYRTDLEGQNVAGYADSDGKLLFLEFVHTAREQKAGYVEYMWQWKDDPNRIVPKVSYIRAFEPWGWIIGTGMYTEDVRGEVVTMTRDLQMIFAGVFLIVLLTSVYLIGYGIQAEMLRRKAEEERAALLEKLEDKNRQLQDFVYTVSHDLRAPLINIRGFSEELRLSCCDSGNPHQQENPSGSAGKMMSSLKTDEIEESLHFIRTNVEKMEGLINGLLQLSRVGTKPMTILPIDMNEELSKVIDAFQYQIKSTDAKIHVGPLPSCLADRDQMNQVFSNLIDNALKYRHPDRVPEIKITGSRKHRMVEYTVADNGIGIESDQINHIFDVFSQIKPDPKIGGIGLGLTIVKRILELSGGQIRVESKVGTGTIFTILLPCP